MAIDENDPAFDPKPGLSGLPWLLRLAAVEPQTMQVPSWSDKHRAEFSRKVEDFRLLAQMCNHQRLPRATRESLDEHAFRAITVLTEAASGRRSRAPRDYLDNLENIWTYFRDILATAGLQVRRQGGRIQLLALPPKELGGLPSELVNPGRQEKQIKELQAAVQRIEDAMGSTLLQRIEAAAKDIEEKREQLARMVVEAGQDATVVKVGSYHKAFAATAARHRAEAKTWLRRTVVLAICTLAISIGLLLLGYWGPSDPESELGVIVGKGAIVAVLVSATVWSGLNYRSHLHNAVVNEHRGDALGSYDAFSAAAQSPAAKDTILVQATGAIYSHQPSGFVAHDGDTSTAGIGLLGAALAAREGKGP